MSEKSVDKKEDEKSNRENKKKIGMVLKKIFLKV